MEPLLEEDFVLVDLALEELLARLEEERIVLDELLAFALELDLEEDEDLSLDEDEDFIRLLELSVFGELLMRRLEARLETLGTAPRLLEVEARGTDLFFMDDLKGEEEVFLVLD